MTMGSLYYALGEVVQGNDGEKSVSEYEIVDDADSTRSAIVTTAAMRLLGVGRSRPDKMRKGSLQPARISVHVDLVWWNTFWRVRVCVETLTLLG